MRTKIGRFQATFALMVALAFPALAQNSPQPRLSRDQFRSGEEILHTLAPVSAKTRYSIVKFYVDSETVSLGAIISSNGLVVTKASELKKGKLTCWTADDRHVDAQVIGTDEEDDVALVRVQAEGLTPIEWAEDEVHVGQWAITPGIAKTPHAIGIISALPRKIRPQRAFIGVQFDARSSEPRVDRLEEGLGAEKVGMKKGDLIVAVNSEAVTNRKQVIDALGEFRQGQTVKLRVKREEDELDFEIELMPPTENLRAGDFESSAEAARLRGQVSQRSQGFEQAIEHDTVLQPWLCGGPLVNLDGKAVGLNIARAGRVTTYALPAKLVKKILKNLQSKAAATPGRFTFESG
jgi:serine protease Do